MYEFKTETDRNNVHILNVYMKMYTFRKHHTLGQIHNITFFLTICIIITVMQTLEYDKYFFKILFIADASTVEELAELLNQDESRVKLVITESQLMAGNKVKIWCNY